MEKYLKLMRLILVGAGVDHFCGSAEIFNLPHKMEVTQKKRTHLSITYLLMTLEAVTVL